MKTHQDTHLNLFLVEQHGDDFFVVFADTKLLRHISSAGHITGRFDQVTTMHMISRHNSLTTAVRKCRQLNERHQLPREMTAADSNVMRKELADKFTRAMIIYEK